MDNIFIFTSYFRLLTSYSIIIQLIILLRYEFSNMEIVGTVMLSFHNIISGLNTKLLLDFVYCL